MKTKVKAFIKKALSFLLNPRLLLCWGIAWLITNGWSYVVLALGTYLDITWMKALGGGYVTFLWLPISPEKLVTAAIAMVLLRLLFPNDQKTLAVVPVEMTYENYKACASEKRLFVVPGAEHALSYCVDQAGYEQNVREFWREYDE